jgi:hypothetical protein
MAKRASKGRVVMCKCWVPLRKDGSVRVSSINNRRRPPAIWDDEVDRMVWGKCTITYTEPTPRVVQPSKRKERK